MQTTTIKCLKCPKYKSCWILKRRGFQRRIKWFQNKYWSGCHAMITASHYTVRGRQQRWRHGEKRGPLVGQPTALIFSILRLLGRQWWLSASVSRKKRKPPMNSETIRALQSMTICHACVECVADVAANSEGQQRPPSWLKERLPEVVEWECERRS